jgi:hypothetical protein
VKEYVKRPVTVQALQWTGLNLAEMGEFLGYPLEEGADVGETLNLFIDTLEGRMMAKPADWVIKGVQGEFYPCKPDIFALTYQPKEVR